MKSGELIGELVRSEEHHRARDSQTVIRALLYAPRIHPHVNTAISPSGPCGSFVLQGVGGEGSWTNVSVIRTTSSVNIANKIVPCDLMKHLLLSPDPEFKTV